MYRYLLQIVIVSVLVPNYIQHFIPPLSNCLLADICNHTWVPECGIDNDEKKLFNDQCDMYEYNCDNKKEYKRTDNSVCSYTDRSKSINGSRRFNSGRERFERYPKKRRYSKYQNMIKNMLRQKLLPATMKMTTKMKEMMLNTIVLKREEVVRNGRKVIKVYKAVVPIVTQKQRLLNDDDNFKKIDLDQCPKNITPGTHVTTEVTTTSATSPTTETTAGTSSALTTMIANITTPVTCATIATTVAPTPETTSPTTETTSTTSSTSTTTVTTTTTTSSTCSTTETTTTTTTSSTNPTTETTTTASSTSPTTETTTTISSTSPTTTTTTVTTTLLTPHTAHECTRHHVNTIPVTTETTTIAIITDYEEITTETPTSVASSVTCKKYPDNCDLPVTWDTTIKGETRDFYQVLRDKYGRRRYNQRYKQRYEGYYTQPRGVLITKEGVGDFVAGRHSDTRTRFYY